MAVFDKQSVKAEQVGGLENKSGDALTALVQADLPFTELLLASDSRFAEDAAHEPFGPGWIKRFGSSLLSTISGKPLDKALEWALSVSALEIAQAIVDNYGISVISYPAAIALAILLLRAAVAELGDKDKPAELGGKDKPVTDEDVIEKDKPF